ncbi:MAG TPA: primosomal protein N' [Syntrophales bacterium]|nr:primosomal protein N' [Syntrophales bacterium]HOL58418.1 primosomal protein N' [Syntrophales bacterium]HPO34587.1 primosomal protein N' [Syntrophales bacterium]
MLAQIALNIQSHQTFTYRVPDHWEQVVHVGMRVYVPFGRTKKTGVIVELFAPAPPFLPVKDIIDLVDTEPLFGSEELRFYRWAADYYLYPLGKALGEILPGGEKKSIQHLKITPLGGEADLDQIPPVQREILDILRCYPRGLSKNSLRKKLKTSHIEYALARLLKAGLIEACEKETGRPVGEKKETLVSLSGELSLLANLTPAQEKVVAALRNDESLSYASLLHLTGVSRNVIARLIQKGILVKKTRPLTNISPVPYDTLEFIPGNIELNEDQKSAIQKITHAIQSHQFTPFLLHGVTGSGKTEVYLRAMEYVLKQGGGILYLVPEIALTPQLVGRLRERFPEEEIALLHSGIPDQVKFTSWRALKNGKIKLACGARSSVFAPIHNLRLIIVDEEHDESYKQEERFPYNARDLALVRGKMQNVTVILGSATPSVQTYHLAQKGGLSLLSLPRRVEMRPLPTVEIVDMRLVGPGDEIISPPLKEAIGDTLKRGAQVVLFLNRRGFHPFLICKSCGYTFKCPNCDLSLTLHHLPARLVCHYCDYSSDSITHCPRCGGAQLAGYGVGTQKVSALVQQFFPSARVCRLDRDIAENPSVRSKILRSIQEKEADIVVGTQMISKGHDFPHIALVGVICADISLNLPDFRAGERTFQLLTQVAGRGGRGETPGRVIIQTFNPDHYVIKYVQDHDYLSFYENEVSYRSFLKYPPFSRLMSIQITSVDKERGWQGAKRLGHYLRAPNLPGTIEILGPAPAPLSRLRGHYRWQIIVKGKDPRTIHALGQIVKGLRVPAGLKLRCDIDPVNFM